MTKFYGVEGFMLCQPTQNCKLRSQHVSFEHGGKHIARSYFHAIRPVVQEHSRRITHYRGGARR